MGVLAVQEDGCHNGPGSFREAWEVARRHGRYRETHRATSSSGAHQRSVCGYARQDPVEGVQGQSGVFEGARDGREELRVSIASRSILAWVRRKCIKTMRLPYVLLTFSEPFEGPC